MGQPVNTQTKTPRQGKVFWALMSFVALGVFGGVAAHALNVSPVRIELTMGQGVQRASFTVSNTQDSLIAIEVTPFIRRQTTSGAEEETPAPDDFIIVPPQMVLEPGAEQIVRIEWLPQEQASAELAYRLNFEQVPVPLDLGASDTPVANMSVAYTYGTAVYVTPRDASSAFEFVGAEVVDIPEAAMSGGDNGTDGTAHGRAGRQILLTVANRGDRRGNIVDASVVISHRASGETVTLGLEELGPFAGGLLLAGAEVTAPLPWPSALPLDADITVEMSATLDIL